MALQQYYVQLQIDGESIGNIGLEDKLLSGFIQKIATIFQGLFKDHIIHIRFSSTIY